MAYLFPLTTLINAITFASKPYICEFPIVKDGVFNNFTRAIRTRASTRKLKDLGLDRTHEDYDSNQIYDVQMRFATYTDQTTVLNELWDGLNEVDPSEFYTWIEIGDVDESQGDGEFVIEFVAIGKRQGKQIGSS